MNTERKRLFPKRGPSVPTWQGLQERGSDANGIVMTGGTMGGKRRYVLKPRSQK